MRKRRVVVTGAGLVSCFGTDIDRFYRALLRGESGVEPITSFPCEEYPTRFAASVRDCDTEGYLDAKQARRVDPCIRYTMVAGKKAAEAAGLVGEALSQIDKERSGVLIGSGMGGMDVFFKGCKTFVEKGFSRITPFFVPYMITNMGGALLAIDLGFKGPNYSISTACATANHCIIAAGKHIREGEADLILCGGTEAAVHGIGLSGFIAMKALSERNDDVKGASRPFDRSRDGFVMGEGSGVLVLEELEHALRRGAPILAEYVGGGTSTDAHHMTHPREDGEGVILAIRKALEDGGVAKERINYVNAHATSTPIGDVCELRAMKKVFGRHAAFIKINATKSMIGHCLGAAAGIEAIAVIRAIRTGRLHPTINLHDPEAEVIPFDLVSGEAVDYEIDVAMSNSFGFGGHNSVTLFSPYRACG